jgi:hypothetical protein
MRQVPVFFPAPVGIVGGGPVARHFLPYRYLPRVSVRTWPAEGLRLARSSHSRRAAQSTREADPIRDAFAAFVRAYADR